ncbi:MAG: tRNA lysidine(34) synthetase TilS [Methylophilaceae bacterium]
MKNKSDVILSEVISSFNDFFKDQKKTVGVTVGLSGGVDSMVLLNVLFQLKTKLNLKLNAIHIHHGLSKNADHWCEVCLDECKKLGVDFSQKNINIDNSEGIGIEAAARKARYQMLHQLSDEFLATAHHQNDQAETLMLQLLRGSGLKGLASMPLFDKERRLWRPFLKISRDAIEEYAKNNNVRFVEDESNQNTEFDRNFLRLEIFPRLIKRFPQTIKSLGRSADLVAEGLNLNKAIANEDAKNYFSEDFIKLNTKIFRTFPRDRVVNLIRWWLEKNQQKMPSQKIMDQIYNQIISAKKDAQINIHISSKMSVRAYKDFLWLVKIKKEKNSFDLIWKGEEVFELPGSGKLLFKPCLGKGISLDKVGSSVLRIQNRKGGERFKPKRNQPTRTLKYLLQKINMPPWERELLPVIYSEDMLVAVPNFGVHHEFVVDEDKIGLTIEWINYESEI